MNQLVNGGGGIPFVKWVLHTTGANHQQFAKTLPTEPGQEPEPPTPSLAPSNLSRWGSEDQRGRGLRANWVHPERLITVSGFRGHPPFDPPGVYESRTATSNSKMNKSDRSLLYLGMYVPSGVQNIFIWFRAHGELPMDSFEFWFRVMISLCVAKTLLLLELAMFRHWPHFSFIYHGYGFGPAKKCGMHRNTINLSI